MNLHNLDLPLLIGDVKQGDVIKEVSKQYEAIKKDIEENKEFIDSKDDIYC